MTHAEIRAAIVANGWQDKSAGEIAALLNAPKTVLVHTEIGKGTVIDVLTLDVANPILDEIESNPRFRHVRGMLEEGKLRLDWQSVQSELGNLVAASIITQSQLDSLLARAEQTVTASVTTQQVIDAMEGM